MLFAEVIREQALSPRAWGPAGADTRLLVSAIPKGRSLPARAVASILSCAMPFYHRVYRRGELQFITASTYRRTPLFLSDRFRRGSEYLDKGQNPRFVVTSLTAEQWAAQDLYEKFYCARGEMENRIKEQMCLFADRLSTDEMKGNQLRLYFSALAYTLMEALRRLGLKGTEWLRPRSIPSASSYSKSAPSYASARAASCWQ